VIGNLALFALAAVLEIAGCFGFWWTLRQGGSRWSAVLGVVSLIGFAWTLTKIDAPFAGRAYAAYGGVYIAASLLWLWAVERQRPSGTDLLGAALSVAGAAIIIAFAIRR